MSTCFEWKVNGKKATINEVLLISQQVKRKSLKFSDFEYFQL